ncbi:hypothetical protein F5X98DRAFT_346797 [Xylaria grammica]|nr:hypothetical protein F5X98DRAFT_346797 [Xylaria grammica]
MDSHLDSSLCKSPVPFTGFLQYSYVCLRLNWAVYCIISRRLVLCVVFITCGARGGLLYPVNRFLDTDLINEYYTTDLH